VPIRNDAVVEEDMVSPNSVPQPEGSKSEWTPNAATETILALYSTAVEMADRVSARRAGANTFFLTTNTALAAIVGIISSARKPPPLGSLPSFDAFGLVATAIAGIVLSWVWWMLLRYYRRLNGAKWDVINKLEKELPAQPFTDEWALLHPNEPTSNVEIAKLSWGQRFRVRSKHREATVVEQYVPFVFMVIYIVLGVRVLVQ
jgi:hypothetical protein